MILDLIVVLIVAIGFYFGFQRGFIKTVFDTASLLIAIIAALKLSPIVIDIINSSLNIAPSIAFIIGVVLTFIVVMALVRFLGRKIEDVFKAANLNFINKINGGFLQALFFAIILSYGVALLNRINVIKQETKDKSMTYSSLMLLPGLSQKMFEGLKPIFKDFWDATTHAMEGVKNKAEEVKGE